MSESEYKRLLVSLVLIAVALLGMVGLPACGGDEEKVGSQSISYWEDSFTREEISDQEEQGAPYRTESVVCEKEDDQHLLCMADYSDGDIVEHRLTVDSPDDGMWISDSTSPADAFEQSETPYDDYVVPQEPVNQFGCPSSAPYPQSSYPGHCANRPAP